MSCGRIFEHWSSRAFPLPPSPATGKLRGSKVEPKHTEACRTPLCPFPLYLLSLHSLDHAAGALVPTYGLAPEHATPSLEICTDTEILFSQSHSQTDVTTGGLAAMDGPGVPQRTPRAWS